MLLTIEEVHECYDVLRFLEANVYLQSFETEYYKMLYWYLRLEKAFHFTLKFFSQHSPSVEARFEFTVYHLSRTRNLIDNLQDLIKLFTDQHSGLLSKNELFTTFYEKLKLFLEIIQKAKDEIRPRVKEVISKPGSYPASFLDFAVSPRGPASSSDVSDEPVSKLLRHRRALSR
jgi:hypothetical protein